MSNVKKTVSSQLLAKRNFVFNKYRQVESVKRRTFVVDANFFIKIFFVRLEHTLQWCRMYHGHKHYPA